MQEWMRETGALLTGRIRLVPGATAAPSGDSVSLRFRRNRQLADTEVGNQPTLM